MSNDRVLDARRDREAGTVAVRELRGTFAELLHAGAVDELQRAAGPSGKADAEDRADVRVVRGGEHAFGQAARRLHRLAIEQAVLQVLHLPRRAPLAEKRGEFGPEEFLRAWRVLVEARAGRAAVAIE